uniref:Uncharacterized protein n=1 Tax=Romanomermis culicivorax TaxID=13658 RepID=A0A915L271_ROMCU
CCSGFGTDSVVSLAGVAAAEICDARQRKPVTTPKMTGDASVVTSYRWTEGTPVPLARFIAQGPPPGIPTDSPLEVLGQLESMNLL